MGTGTDRRIVRFGEFEFEPRAGELRRHGQRVTIQEQPLLALEMLIACPGQLVTRQELCERLWPAAFVDFDNGLNNAISRLRTALDDRARTPPFIQTVGRRGYRFNAPVEGLPEAAGSTGVRAWLIGDRDRVALQGGENILGRRGSGVLELASATVSRRHARITIHDEALIEDLGSKNGTFVEGRPVTTAVRLGDGNQVRIGSLTLRFTLVGSGDDTRTVSIAD